MKEHPILFSGPMIRAILDGRKTQTRRIVKPQPIVRHHWSGPDDHGIEFKDRTVRITSLDRYQDEIAAALCLYGSPGDRLWVRETFGQCRHGKPHPECIEYRADGDPEERRWTPSIYMPRWASRLTLEITSVRVERLQSISEKDARAEGAPLGEGARAYPSAHAARQLSHRDGFRELWDSINGKRASWADNPFVWAVGFRRLP